MDSKIVRGAIRHKERAQQLRDFTGLRFGKITPTDIDALIEYQGKAYIVIEAKSGDAKMSYGQELAFTRLCDDLQKSGKKSIFIVAYHNIPVEESVNYAECNVEKYRYNGEWRYTKANVRQLIDGFISKL